MNGLFANIGRGAVRYRWGVLLVWAGLLVFAAFFAPRLHEVFERESMARQTGEAQEAADVIAAKFHDRSAYQQQLVLTSDSLTVDDPLYRQAAESIMATVKATGLVTDIDSYFSGGDSSLVSPDRHTTYALLNLRSKTHADGMTAAGKILDAVEDAEMPQWFAAYVTGLEASHADLIKAGRESLSRAEAVGLPAALMVLILVFGALAAAVLPLGIAALSIAIAFALAFLVGQWMDLNVMTENFATMIGLGVGIDYSLFMLTRYRAERKAGRDVNSAVVETMTHAGKAIAFSGSIVAIGFFAFLTTGDGGIVSLGIGGILVVLVAVAAALTLLPAVLALLGDRIEVPRSLSRVIVRTHRSGFWGRWANGVMRRPALYLIFALAIMAALAWPTLDLKKGSVGVKMLGEEAQSRQGYEVLAKEFGPGIMSPVQIVVSSKAGINDPLTVEGIYHLTEAIEGDKRFAGAVSIASLLPGQTLKGYQDLYRDGFDTMPDELGHQVGRLVNVGGGADTTIVLARLADDPGADSSRRAIRALRGQIIPSIPELRGDDVLVGGSTAQEMDSIDHIYSRFPVVIALILSATFVLLLVLLRSILIPLKAVLMNLLSVFASYGLLVLVFQEGIGDGLLGFKSVGSVTSVTPVLLFGLLFGLSMDYEVFLMSRMRELHDRGHSNEESVSIGLERTGGVITGAALIMIVVFAAFTLSPILAMKELGFGLAAAVFLDATIVRVILVPATMRLLGEWNWWLPQVLTKVLPSVELEREASDS